MQTNQFRITQWGDEDFTIDRLYIIPLETFANMFRKVKKTEEDWRVIKDYKKSGKYYYPAKRFETLIKAKAFIDKTLLDEATYPIVTRHP